MKRRHKRPATNPQTIEFEIEHIDPLGQGVSKKGGAVTFLAGTLPGETGKATVFKRAKGVQFARLLELDTRATNRVEPVCPHFEQCPGCQFLHTDYESELAYKQKALCRQLAALDITDEDIEVFAAPRRLSYRNRVQLHYRHKYIGMLDTVSNQVLEIPNCKILRKELEPEFASLQKGEWVSDHQGHGHCELYLKSGEVSLSWDQPYAHGGFSQVFEEMNTVLREKVQAQLAELGSQSLLDLFSGSGNLSDEYAASGGQRTLVDSFIDRSERKVPDGFHQMDLYGEHTFPNFMRKIKEPNFDTILLDPPRRGFPGLDQWVSKIKPRHVIYVSCNPSSLARDLRSLSVRYRIKSVQLLDLFPATSHFETLVVLEVLKGSPKRLR